MTRLVEPEKEKTLFQRLVELCGLSSIFAHNSMKRACKRAGVDPEKLSKADVHKLPSYLISSRTSIDISYIIICMDSSLIYIHHHPKRMSCL